MLQQFGRKKSSSLNDDLIVGGACIIHNKLIPSKKSLLHLKTDKTDKYAYNLSADPQKNSQETGKYFKISSSQKAKIKYLKSICKESSIKQNQYNFESNRNSKPIFKKKNVFFSDMNQNNSSEFQQPQSPSKRFRRNLISEGMEKINRTQCTKQMSKKRIQNKILPEITQKLRSYTISNSKKKIRKQLSFLNSGQQTSNESNRKVYPPMNNLPNLEYSQDIQTKYRLKRNYTTKVERISNDRNDQNAKNSIQNSSCIKKAKKQMQSQKQIKILNQPKGEKVQRQKGSKFLVIRDQFTSIINQTNQIQVVNDNSCFNAFVEKGNNGMLVKELLKNRWWWHFSDQKPIDCQKDTQNQNLKENSSTQPVSSHKKKVNLYWSQWINKGFAEKLQPDNDQFQQLRTVYDQFQFSNPLEQPKYDSVKKITDSITFDVIKDKISLRNANYFKNRFPKPISNDQFNFYSNKSSQHQLLSKPKIPSVRDNNSKFKRIQMPQDMKIHNHVVGCLELHSKKLLFKNFSAYLKKQIVPLIYFRKNMDPFDFIPLTFYIECLNSQNFAQFLKYYDKFQASQVKFTNMKTLDGSNSIWILKPGQNSNRGFGISIHKQKQQIRQELIKRLGQSSSDDQNPKKAKKSVIVQKYIQKCFLINNRKFDFRCYILITTVNGFLKGYWYGNGYIRTSSEEYNLNDIQNRMIHLTNDAVQSKNSTFGKFQDYNKLSFQGFRKYLQKQNIPSSKFQDSFKRMKKIAYYLIASVSPKIKRYQYTFELFGLDFMLDQNLNPYLIEANSNPCLDTKGPILTKIIRDLVENVIMTAIDPLFPNPKNFVSKKKKDELCRDYFESNMFELIFTDKKSFEQN